MSTWTKWVVLFLAYVGVTPCHGGEINPVPQEVSFRPPVLTCWFWHDLEFEPDGYKQYVDFIVPVWKPEIFTASMRVNLKEVTDQDVIEQMRKATEYAREKGVGVAWDLDVRMARKAFQKAHPDEMQEMLCIREAEIDSTGQAAISVTSQDLNDHYTGRTTHYIPLGSRLVRAYLYQRTPEGIQPTTIREIAPEEVHVTVNTANQITVELKPQLDAKGATFCVLVAFSHFAADVFGPHLLEFQRSILQQYAGMGLAGACKDEWGFPPCFDGCPKKDDYWYSEPMRAAYQTHTGGRDLLSDIPLMTYGEVGRESERLAAINFFNELVRQRNTEIEVDFFKAVKEILGKDALAATHPTWYPFPGVQEFKKNGLDWWGVPRNIAQTDEVTPFCVRTALAKKWNSPVCVNMYYNPEPVNYHREMWTTALIGGRINHHPPYPLPEGASSAKAQSELMDTSFSQGEMRVRLLNYIDPTPLDCPVAVVFGEACALNWAGPAYADVGMGLADALWQAGYPADLIPTYEVENGSMQVDPEGYVRYGKQRYSAVVLYHPEMSKPCVSEFFWKADEAKKTALYRVGKWSMDFEGKEIEVGAKFPLRMQLFPDTAEAVPVITAKLQKEGVAPQTPATEQLNGFGYNSTLPPRHGINRLVDGTRVIIAGGQSTSGDPIEETLDITGNKVQIKALGVAGIRLREDGSLEALAAGGLTLFSGGGIEITLEKPIDLAIWKQQDGSFQGVTRKDPTQLPNSLQSLVKEWRRID